MIKKTLLQGMIVVVAFMAIWLALSQVDFVTLFDIRKKTLDTEQKIGEILWNSVKRTKKVVTEDSVIKPVNKLIQKLAEENNINLAKIKLHIIAQDEVNAFAMPDNHLIIYTGLIAACDNEGALAGVLGHEIAHMEKNHVMKKLVKEMGLSVLLSMAGGHSGATAREATKLLSSSAYDRTLESEADITSVDYLIKSDIDPEEFANMLYKMSKSGALPDGFSWMQTHPDSEDRATAIIEYIEGRPVKKREVLSAAEWNAFKRAVDRR